MDRLAWTARKVNVPFHNGTASKGVRVWEANSIGLKHAFALTVDRLRREWRVLMGFNQGDGSRPFIPADLRLQVRLSASVGACKSCLRVDTQRIGK